MSSSILECQLRVSAVVDVHHEAVWSSVTGDIILLAALPYEYVDASSTTQIYRTLRMLLVCTGGDDVGC